MAEPRQARVTGDDAATPDVPTQPSPVVRGEDKPGLHVRMFGSHQFFRLWITQVVSATGDWLGFLAIAALAARIGAGSPEAAIGVVMAARIVPGFFLGAAAGVVVDRFDRKKVMVVCDVGRAAVLATLPFVDTVLGLVLASLVMEVLTLLWAPAKEASVPHLVPPEHLTTANSLSLVAAYGTVPLAAGLFALLAKVSEWLGSFEALEVLRPDRESVAFYADSVTFLVSALMISTLTLPARRKRAASTSRGRIDVGQAFHELKAGWHFAFLNPVVRAVNIGLAAGLIGGGMLVPLGPVFSERVLGAGSAGFGVFIFALGCGVAVGVVLLSVFQRRLPKGRIFAASVLGAGVCLLIASSMSALGPAALLVAALGVCAGSVYVLGFTLLHENVTDDMRGRIFSALYTMVRFCVLVAFAVGPFLAEFLDTLSRELVDGDLSLIGFEIPVPGVRLTLWVAGAIIILAGVLAAKSLRAGAVERSVEGHPSSPADRHGPRGLVQRLTEPISEVRESHDAAGDDRR